MLINSRITSTYFKLLVQTFDTNENYFSKSRIKEVRRKFLNNPLTNVAILSPSRSWKEPPVANRYDEYQKPFSQNNSSYWASPDPFSIVTTTSAAVTTALCPGEALKIIYSHHHHNHHHHQGKALKVSIH